MRSSLTGRLYDFLLRRKLASFFRGVGAPAGDGLSLVANFENFTSLAHVARAYADALAGTGIRFSCLNTRLFCSRAPGVPAPELVSVAEHAARKVDFGRILFFTGEDEFYRPAPGFSSGCVCFWEFAEGLWERRGRCLQKHGNLIASTDFLQDVLRSSAPGNIAVHKVRYPFPAHAWTPAGKAETRRRYGIPGDEFVVFFNFAHYALRGRKNQLAVLDAYARAGLAGRGDARVVFKIRGVEPESEAARATRGYASSLGIRNFTMIFAPLSHQEIVDLTAASDVYVSLHRGEGLGLGILEAMDVGVPVVATNYGGNTDFCKDETAFLVGYKMVRPETDEEMFRTFRQWPEPDIDEAADCLRHLFDHPGAGRAKAESAARFIGRYYARENFEADVRRMMDAWRD